MALVVSRTGQVLASTVEFARSSTAQRWSLLGRPVLEDSTALVLAPCSAVRTEFGRFPIDVVFLDQHDAVVQIVHDLPPRRSAVSPFACTAVELPAGTVQWRDLRMGDQLRLTLEHERQRLGSWTSCVISESDPPSE